MGFAEKGYERAEELLAATLEAVASCPCENGCPNCIHSPKCSNFNRPLDKEAAIMLLYGLLGQEYERRDRKVCHRLCARTLSVSFSGLKEWKYELVRTAGSN